MILDRGEGGGDGVAPVLAEVRGTPASLRAARARADQRARDSRPRGPIQIVQLAVGKHSIAVRPAAARAA